MKIRVIAVAAFHIYKYCMSTDKKIIISFKKNRHCCTSGSPIAASNPADTNTSSGPNCQHYMEKCKKKQNKNLKDKKL